MRGTLEYLCLAALGFLLGGVLFSYHLPMLLKGVDVTIESEDHNPGTANAVKYAGVPVGLLCLAADMLKGFLPVRIGLNTLNAENMWFALVLAAPTWGHAAAPFYQISGGKGIAVSFGILLALLPVSGAFWALSGVYIVLSTVAPVHPNERRTIVAFAFLSLWGLLVEGRRKTSFALGYMAITTAVVWKNRRKCEKSRRVIE